MVFDAALAKRSRAGLDVDAMAEQARAASDVLKALAHEGRLMILCHLVAGEKSVSELEDLIGARQAAVSQQLARLRFDRLVNTRRDGRVIYYSIASAEVSSVIETLYNLFCAPVRNRDAADVQASGSDSA